MAKEKKGAEWLVRGVLTKIGETLDARMGRKTPPRSTLATSELANQLIQLIDAKAKGIPGKGRVAPHNFTIKLEWDKFSAESDAMITSLEEELTIAALDHINDSLYHTLAPIKLTAARDYFVKGVRLTADYGAFDDASDIEEVDEIIPIPLPLDEDPQPEMGAAGGRAVQRQSLVSAIIMGRDGSETTRAIDLAPDGRVTVGRAASNLLMIDDASVSKIHATVVVSVGNALSVADTGSTNGTFINDDRIAYGIAVPFQLTDTLTFGDVKVRFDLSDVRGDSPR